MYQYQAIVIFLNDEERLAMANKAKNLAKLLYEINKEKTAAI